MCLFCSIVTKGLGQEPIKEHKCDIPDELSSSCSNHIFQVFGDIINSKYFYPIISKNMYLKNLILISKKHPGLSLTVISGTKIFMLYYTAQFNNYNNELWIHPIQGVVQSPYYLLVLKQQHYAMEEILHLSPFQRLNAGCSNTVSKCF